MKIWNAAGVRRICTILCVFCIMLVPCTVNYIAYAKDTAKITASSEVDKRGETVSVSFELSENLGIWGLKFKVGYDHTALRLDSVKIGNVFAEGEITQPENLNKEMYVFYASGDKLENILTNGTLVTLNFVISKEAAFGDYAIAVNVIQAINADGDEVRIGTVNGKVTVQEPPTETEAATVKPTETESTTVKPTETEATTVKPTETEATTVKPTETESTTVKPTETEAATVKPTETEAATVKPAETVATAARPVAAQTTTKNVSSEKASENRTSMEESSSVKPSMEQTSSAEVTTQVNTKATASSPDNSEVSGKVETNSNSLAVIAIVTVLIAACAGGFVFIKRYNKR